MAPSDVGNTMIGAIYESFNEPIKISNDLPIPHPPSDGVIVKVMATGVCRSDWHGWRGHDDDIKQYIEKHGTPFVPGHEASGIVVEVGSDIKQFKVGDRVAIPFILSCGQCRECGQSRQPTVCEDQHQPGFTMVRSHHFSCTPRFQYNLSCHTLKYLITNMNISGVHLQNIVV